jgi:glucokinase
MIGAVDIGGTKIAVGIVNGSGQVKSHQEWPTDADSYVNGLAMIAGMLRETAQIAGVEITRRDWFHRSRGPIHWQVW